MTTTAADIIAAAQECIGTKWVHQGRVPGSGLDCVGLVLYVAKKTGEFDFEPPPYARQAKWDEFLTYFDQHLTRVPILQAQPGDVLTFRQDVYPCHCGIMSNVGPAGEPRFIHSYALRRKVVEEQYTAEWKTLTRAVYRFPGLK